MTLAQNVPRILPVYSILPDLCPRACHSQYAPIQP